MTNVLITVSAYHEAGDETWGMLEAGGCTVAIESAVGKDQEELIELIQGNDAVIAGGEAYTDEVLRRADTLKHVARWGVGFDKVDLGAATEHGVLVTTTQGANDWGVADHAMALILGLGHLIAENDRRVKAGEWPRVTGRDVWQRTIGIVGLGRIGQGVARRAGGFDMGVLAYEPMPNREFVERHGVELVSIEDLLRRADYVTLHLPLSPETHHFMNAERLALMKPTAYLVNTARGPLIDEDALESALRAGRIGGAGLDVREVEPAQDTRFSDLPNVILSPHSAGITDGTVTAMGRMAAESILAGRRGERPHGLLNPEAWERRRR
jgi:D-3-phosphoglycerate dehydrogenase / 2-oxoglutarate reductase